MRKHGLLIAAGALLVVGLLFAQVGYADDSITLPCRGDDCDLDGCTDEQEAGPDETLGGLRNMLNPWDFYDINGDQIIDLSNDIFDVIQHYYPNNDGGANPYPAGYEVFDRGPSTGPYPWSMTEPDGVIDLTNDILGVIQQYLHSCQ